MQKRSFFLYFPCFLPTATRSLATFASSCESIKIFSFFSMRKTAFSTLGTLPIANHTLTLFFFTFSLAPPPKTVPRSDRVLSGGVRGSVCDHAIASMCACTRVRAHANYFYRRAGMEGGIPCMELRPCKAGVAVSFSLFIVCLFIFSHIMQVLYGTKTLFKK